MSSKRFKKLPEDTKNLKAEPIDRILNTIKSRCIVFNKNIKNYIFNIFI